MTGTWFTIGSFGNTALGRVDPNDPNSPLKDPVRPVDDGATDQNGTVAVTCSVKPSGGGFAVAAHAELTGAKGGAVTMTGTFQPSGSNPSIALALTKQGATFSANDCVGTFDSALGQAVAAGRIWVSVECANATQPAAQQTCRARAQLRFENCAQQ